ncbi:MAG: hypothetical protein ACRDZX_08050, partial [Acidimicrobiales bacterium]
PGRGGPPASGCTLGPSGDIHHVIYMQFDNTHFLRDNPNVPSDIEQMPALLNFMEHYGTVLDNDHTPLIAHTANDLLTSETGLYPDHQGIAEANSYRYYEADGSTDTAGSFSYWTDRVDSYTTANGLGIGDSNYNLVGPGGQNVPAPWVPFTRAGCNVGEVALADLDLENALPDVATVFGASSPEAADAANPNFPTQTEFQGLAVHCAKGNAFCAGNPRPVPDLLPDEPGGYVGYQAVFGAKYLDNELSPNGPPANLDGQVITDSSGNVGFPGYDSMQPVNALAYTLDMQTHGVPVTYTYLTDTHDNAVTGNGMGPGEPAYEAQLHAYNQGFADFFADLQADGITPANTLFVFGEDENDHYVGSAPSPSGCDGVSTPCSYSQLGEVDTDLTGLMAGEEGITTPFQVHADSAPFIYLPGQPRADDPTVRAFERGLAQLTAPDPYTGQTVKLANYLADPVELNVLHMVTSDPARTPTLTMFANPDFYLETGQPTCSATTPGPSSCESFDTAVWNHGDISPDINQSWMAFVGPGVRNLGVDNAWASEADTRPTLMALLGLKDDYSHEGVVLSGLLGAGQFPPSLTSPDYVQLASTYTALESPVGPFALATLDLSTRGLASGSPTDDSVYQSTEQLIAKLGNQRDALGSLMIRFLERAAFSGHHLPPGLASHLVQRGDQLIQQAEQLAGGH